MIETKTAMTPQGFKASIDELGLTMPEAALLLGLSDRTLRRYLDDEDPNAAEPVTVPGPVEQALRAWLRLHRQGLAWRPDAQSIEARNDASIAQHRLHSLELDEMLQRVKARGGPSLPWEVDFERGRATLGAMTFTFYRLANGGFSPQSYTRRDMPPDAQRDWPMLEEGFACVARELGRQGFAVSPPVSLGTAGIYQDQVILWEDRPFPTFVLRIPVDVARAAAGAGSDQPLSRLLDFMNSNRGALARLALRLVAEERGAINSLGAREIVLDAAQLRDAKLRRRIFD